MAAIEFPITPALMSPDDFAKWHGIDRKTVDRCIAAASDSYPPLKAKRVRKPGSKVSRIYITAEAAAEWRANLKDA